MNKTHFKQSILILSFLFSVGFAFTQVLQAPEKLSYQSVIRRTNNDLVVNQNVRVKISILHGSTTGTAFYVEDHTTSTNSNGLVSLSIGGGNVISGSFSAINWEIGPYFVKMEADPTGGTNYTVSGTSQLLSVPYALYAKTSGSSTPGPTGAQGIQGVAGINGTNGTNGTNGVDGKNTVVKTTTEAAGANCATGGVKMEYGLDANNNGVLDAGEINATLTKYVCNGTITSGTQTLSINGVSSTQYIPDYLYDTGNCSDGNFSTTGNYTLNSTFAQYCNLSINSGHTFSLGGTTSSSTYTIIVKDTLRIFGSINGINGSVFPSGDITVSTAGGTGGGAKAINSASTQTGNNAFISWDSYNNLGSSINPASYSFQISGGTSTNLNSSCGGNGNSSMSQILREAIKIRSNLFGTDGGHGSTNLTNSYPAGMGGDGLYIICKVLIFNGSIVLKGAPGISAGAGAGGGGSLVISAETILDSSGLIVQTGGVGSGGGGASASTCDNGGNGGDGAYLIIDR
jgi:hypothetical protein